MNIHVPPDIDASGANILIIGTLILDVRYQYKLMVLILRFYQNKYTY